MLGKTFKGLTDRVLQWQSRRLLELEIARDDYTVHVRPELVVEVAFNDAQTSQQYSGGLGLRLARIKGYRPDKGAEEADIIDTMRLQAATSALPSARSTEMASRIVASPRCMARKTEVVSSSPLGSGRARASASASTVPLARLP